MILSSQTGRKFLWVALFSVAFALVESSVVVYLRSLYYPHGFEFPLKLISPQHLVVELSREAATIVMLVAVGALAGARVWEKFAYFLVAFGVWDIFYYVWLKAFLDWPASLGDWDILFLIPLPWIGPVVAPVLISLLMIVCGSLMVLRIEKSGSFHPGWLPWSLSILGTVIVLYSFMADTQATLYGQEPTPYQYSFLLMCLLLYAISFALSFRSPTSRVKA
jgi:hypothetical protein